MNEQELAQNILALMKQAEEDGAKAVSETFEQDYYLAAWDDIKKLCQQYEIEQVK